MRIIAVHVNGLEVEATAYLMAMGTSSCMLRNSQQSTIKWEALQNNLSEKPRKKKLEGDFSMIGLLGELA